MTSTKVAPGTLRVTISAGAASSGSNTIQQIRFGSRANAIIDTGTQAASGNFTVTLPAQSVVYTFTVKRSVTGQATTVPLTVIDWCGEWSTLIGGGATAF